MLKSRVIFFTFAFARLWRLLHLQLICGLIVSVVVKDQDSFELMIVKEVYEWVHDMSGV